MTDRHYSSSAGKMVLQLGITAVATAMQVDTTAGLPGATPYSLLVDMGLPTEEIVTVTQVSGNTLVVIRGEDGTSAQPHASGAVVRHGITARDLRDSRDHENATSGVHGITGSVVGTSDTQGLTNKDLSSSTNTFPATLATDSEVTAAIALEATTRATADSNHASATATHGVTGAIVGTTNTQTLTNKTINGPIIGTPTFSDDVPIGDITSTTARQFKVRRKAATGTNYYEGLVYIQSGDDNGNLSLVLNQNGVEVARANVKYNGDFQVTTGDVLGNNIPTLGVAGTTAAKAKKRLHWGSTSATTNASGKITVTHGAGFSPSSVNITPQNTPYQVNYESVGATTFVVQFASADGTALANTAVGFSWLLGE